MNSQGGALLGEGMPCAKAFALLEEWTRARAAGNVVTEEEIG